MWAKYKSYISSEYVRLLIVHTVYPDISPLKILELLIKKKNKTCI